MKDGKMMQCNNKRVASSKDNMINNKIVKSVNNVGCKNRMMQHLA